VWGWVTVKYFGVVTVCVVLCAGVGALLGGVLVPEAWVRMYGVPERAAGAFKAVAGEHYGLYGGALIGMFVAWRRCGGRAVVEP